MTKGTPLSRTDADDIQKLVVDGRGRDSLRKVEDEFPPGIAPGSEQLITDDMKPQMSSSESDEEDMVEMEFTIGGMTCVNCSSSIERMMHNEFDDKGLKKVSIVLLTHKMTATFTAIAFKEKTVTPDAICEEVEMIGFDCEQTGMNEISA